MKKVTLNDYGKELQLFRKIRRWAKEMGAPVEILQDLKNIEENRDFVHQIFSEGWDEKFQHILTHVKPLCEAEHRNNTLALYKAQLLSGKVDEMNVEEQLKSAAYVQAYLKAKEKTENIKKLKKKLKAVEKNIESITKMIEIDCCLYEQLKEELSDLTKKTVLIDLKAKCMSKQIDEMDEVTETFKNLNLAYNIPKTPVVHSIPKKSKLTPEIEAMVTSWVKRYMGINKASLGSEVYDTGRDADAMLDDLINDLMLPKVQVPSKDIMTALVKIVVEYRKTMIKTMEENVDDQSFSEHRQNNGKYVTALMEFHHESDEELKRLRKSVRHCELELMSLHTELAEELVSHVPDVDEGETDHQEIGELVEDYLDRLAQVKRLREMNSFMMENITVLSEEAVARSTRHDTFQSYVPDKRNASNLLTSLQDQLKAQGSQVRQLTETDFRSAFQACKELEFIDLKGISFESMKAIFLDELEIFLSNPIKIITRSWESDVSMFSTEAKTNLVKETDAASGPDHKTINNMLNLLIEYRKVISLSLPTVETKILSLIDNHIKEVELMKNESVKMIIEKPEKLEELMTETDKMQDEVDIVLKDWKELPFYDWKV